MKLLIHIKQILVITLISIIAYGCSVGKNDVTYKYGEVTKGSIETSVTSTGTLEPLTSIDVGTQVSGTITRVLIDYNDTVKKGQLLAVLDTFLLKLSVDEAVAKLDKTKALLEQSTSEYERKKVLYIEKLLSESDFIPYKTSYKIAKAEYKLSKISYTKAKRNLKYAYITSPIDGVIIGKEVEEGQTVASSLSAPTLFNVAQDLREIRILAQIDESDIGTIKEGMDVKFSVQAYSDREYTGEVTQIRLQSQDISNVINYTAVISAKNDDKTLLPGMTTTVDFIVSVTENVFMVPSKALKYTPSDDVVKAFMETMHKQRMAKDSTREGRPARKMNNKKEKRQRPTMLWYMNDNGEIQAIPVRVGDTNGSYTEISSRDKKLTEGLKIIISSTSKKKSSSSKKTSLNNQQRGGGMGGPPPRF